MSCDASSSAVPWRQLRLSNGAELQVAQRPWPGEVGLCLRVAAGSHDEPVQYPGLAHFLEHLLFRGSLGYGADDGLMAYVRERGGQVNASTRAHHTDFVCSVPVGCAQPALDRLLDMLCHPQFDLAAQLGEREVLHAEYLARSAQADARIDHALAQALADGHRCRDFLAGDRMSLPVEQASFQQALRAYHQHHYQAASMRLVLVGPQPLEQLLAMGEQRMVHVPGTGEPQPGCHTPMLPLRARRLQLQQASVSVHLGLVVMLAGLDEALALVLDALTDPGVDGLLDDLRRAGLCRDLQARVLYHHAGQCLLRLDFPGGTADRLATLRSAVQCWIRQAGAADGWPQRVSQWQRAAAYRHSTAAPLALAREQSAAWPLRQPHELLADVHQVLARMAATEAFVELLGDSPVQPRWPAVGLDLPLRACPDRGNPTWQSPARLPAREPLLDGVPAARLPAAQLHWDQASPDGGPAVVYWRAGAAVPVRLGDPAPLQARCQRLGVDVRLDLQPGTWQLRLQGPGALLPACSVAWLVRLLAQDEVERQELPSGMPIRQLLDGAPQLAADMNWRGPLQGFGVGMSAQDGARLQAVFERCNPCLQSMAWTAPGTGLHWQQVAAPGEAALLLFCPLPDAEARTEAAWRLLGQWLQGTFYRRLRSELQLGYALFAGFRQVGGRRGLLFALQSPICGVEQVLRHFSDFFEAQDRALASLDNAAVRRLCEGLQGALGAARTQVDRAERRWQTHISGLPDDHDLAVYQSLGAMQAADLRLACAQLRAAHGGWRVLANGPQANL